MNHYFMPGTPNCTRSRVYLQSSVILCCGTPLTNTWLRTIAYWRNNCLLRSHCHWVTAGEVKRLICFFSNDLVHLKWLTSSHRRQNYKTIQKQDAKQLKTHWLYGRQYTRQIAYVIYYCLMSSNSSKSWPTAGQCDLFHPTCDHYHPYLRAIPFATVAEI